jgi:hypothetical protein
MSYEGLAFVNDFDFELPIWNRNQKSYQRSLATGPIPYFLCFEISGGSLFVYAIESF